MIVFRVDGNETIASGHIMRCLTYASYFKKIGLDSTFICSDGSFKNKILEEKYDCIVLNSDFRHMDSELLKLMNILNKLKPEFIIIDSYFVTEKYLKKLSNTYLTVYIDDLNRFNYPVNAIINYCVGSKREDYPCDEQKQFFLGTQYAPLREEFLNAAKRNINSDIRNVLVTTGGADISNFNTSFIDFINFKKLFPHLHFNIIIGKMFSELQIEKLKEQALINKNISLHFNVEDMVGCMIKNDIAISTGGSTLYELCFLGIPTIAIKTASNQQANLIGFTKIQALIVAGDARENGIYKNVCKNIIFLTLFENRKNISENAKKCFSQKNDVATNIFNSLKSLK